MCQIKLFIYRRNTLAYPSRQNWHQVPHQPGLQRHISAAHLPFLQSLFFLHWLTAGRRHPMNTKNAKLNVRAELDLLRITNMAEPTSSTAERDASQRYKSLTRRRKDVIGITRKYFGNLRISRMLVTLLDTAKWVVMGRNGHGNPSLTVIGMQTTSKLMWELH